ncbi:hypothetical protein Dimus_028663 [Dionaea muscipula]
MSQLPLEFATCRRFTGSTCRIHGLQFPLDVGCMNHGVVVALERGYCNAWAIGGSEASHGLDAELATIHFMDFFIMMVTALGSLMGHFSSSCRIVAGAAVASILTLALSPKSLLVADSWAPHAASMGRNCR